MDWVWTFFLCILGSVLVLLHRRRGHSAAAKAVPPPPGPRGWPVFGNVFSLGSMPHKTIAMLQKDYGPVVGLKIGSINTVVLQNAKAAAELFKHHDTNFADRKIIEVMKSHNFYKSTISLSPYGSYWRTMKRIVTVEMLTQKRLNESEAIRQRCIAQMVEWIEADAATGESGGVQVGRLVFLSSFNMLGNLMLSRDLVSPKSDEGSEFSVAMAEVMDNSGRPNIADLFPWLQWLDPQGLRRKSEAAMGRALKIVVEFVEKRLKESTNDGGSAKKDFLEVLMEQKGSKKNETDQISDHDVCMIIVEAFAAGTDTTSSTIEWVMFELLRNPETMNKAKNELTQVIEKSNRFEERHIENLPYLQAVVKETLRLHPPVPFLVPRRAIQETEFMGYHIPKDTQLFVNAWAIGRDPECWDDPLSFKPERFLGSNIDYKGQNFELIPFGAGRRICAGMALAHRMLHQVLGSLLHEFDWSLDEIGKSTIMDTRERIGVTVRKLVPLKAIPRKCST